MKNLEPKINRQRPEILAPVGNHEMLKAAIHHGADAVYIGMPGFNARARTEDLSFETLREWIEEAHTYGVRVLVAFNILIFQEELEGLYDAVRALVSCAPDAVIVQDLGLVRFIKACAPNQVVHASTQMTVTHHRAIRLLEDLDIRRFVLGREVSMDEMKTLRQETDKELEVFVHGALCVAYSGQCLTSENMGGRSANRGQCAQSCRLPYGLVVDGKLKDMGERSRLVSPKDLCGLEDAPSLAALGIDSFKIEGRYKSPEYVATTVAAYGKASRSLKVPAEDRLDMEMSFSRGMFSGWLHGVNHNQLVDGLKHHHIGSPIGVLLGFRLDKNIPKLKISTRFQLNKGDGLLFISTEGKELQGGKIYEICPLKENEFEIHMSRDFKGFALKGQRDVQVYCNRSVARDKRWQQGWKDKQSQKKIPLVLELQARLGEPVRLRLEDPDGRHLTVFTETSCEQASKKALDEASVQKAISGWGASAFEVSEIKMDLGADLFMPHGQLKALRQMAQREIELLRQGPTGEIIKSETEMVHWMDKFRVKPSDRKSPSSSAQLKVLIRSPEQLQALENLDVSGVILDFRHGMAYGPVIAKARDMGLKVIVATTRIVKPGEERRLLDLLRLKPDGVLVRNLAALQFLHENAEDWSVEWWGDFSFNICNHLSADYLLSKGLDFWSPSYDLNLHQLERLMQNVDVAKVELTVHQYMPSFHMEHCVFATFLSDGSDISNCGMVCRQHEVALRDEKGVEHPLLADQECRNTMFNGSPQSVASLLPDFQSWGVQHFRLEALKESPTELRKKIQGYLAVLTGSLDATSLKRQLGVPEQFGITEGQLLNDRVYVPRKKSDIN